MKPLIMIGLFCAIISTFAAESGGDARLSIEEYTCPEYGILQKRWMLVTSNRTVRFMTPEGWNVDLTRDRKSALVTSPDAYTIMLLTLSGRSPEEKSQTNSVSSGMQKNTHASKSAREIVEARFARASVRSVGPCYSSVGSGQYCDFYYTNSTLNRRGQGRLAVIPHAGGDLELSMTTFTDYTLANMNFTRILNSVNLQITKTR